MGGIPDQFKYQPLLVMNGFASPDLTEKQKSYLKLVTTVFQNMFPALQIDRVSNHFFMFKIHL